MAFQKKVISRPSEFLLFKMESLVHADRLIADLRHHYTPALANDSGRDAC